MDKINGATDLSKWGKQIEGNNEMSPPKRAKTELPSASPSGSDNNAPLLEPVAPVETPDFNLAGVAEEYFATCTPPLLQREIEISESSQTHVCQPSTSHSMKPGPQTGSHSTQKPEERQASMPSIGFKTAHNRLSRVSSNSIPNKLTDHILQKTITALKNECPGISQKNGRKEKQQTRDVRSTPTQNSQPKRGRRSNTNTRTPEEVKQLEARYAANPNPGPTEVYEIAHTLSMTTSDVKKWFTARKRQVGVQTHDSLDSGFSDEPGTSANAMKSLQINRHIVQTPRHSYDTSILDADGNVQNIPGDKSGRLKFLKKPGLRTNDFETIKKDVENVKKCKLDIFRAILDTKWEVKANRILSLVASKGFGCKRKIYVEAKRLQRMAVFALCISEGQEREVLDWKKRFIEKKKREEKYATDESIEKVVEETVIPWIAPYIYSRLTHQDGRYLNLEVALHDFCRISEVQTNDVTSSEWITPSLLQNGF